MMPRSLLAAAALAVLIAALLLACGSGSSTARGFVTQPEAGGEGGALDATAIDGATTDGSPDAGPAMCCEYPAWYQLGWANPKQCPATMVSPCGGNVQCDAGGCTVINGVTNVNGAGTLTTCTICSGVYAAIAWDASPFGWDSGPWTTFQDATVPAPGVRQCTNPGVSIVNLLSPDDQSCMTLGGTPLESTVCVCASGTGCVPTSPGSDLDGGYECR